MDVDLVMNGNISVLGQTITLLRKQIVTALAHQIAGVQPMPRSHVNLFKIRSQYTSKYKFSRAKWYVATFDTQYYDEVEAWCAEQFGPHPKQPDAWSRWVHKYEEQIFFRDEEDYIMFKLRWGA